jgi:hypothetical protein
MVRMEVSSAKVAVSVPGDDGWYNSGPNTLPCGTPAFIPRNVDYD